jgi:acetolactate synthase-1/3 small subunit
MPTPSDPSTNGAGAAAAPTVPERLRLLSVEVENNPGILFRVAGMIRRRGFNIEGLSVGRTGRPGRSRMTLTVHAGAAEVDQVEKQLDRLIEVIEIEDLTEQPRLNFQLALVKLAVTGERRAQAVAEVERFGGRVVDEGPEQVIIQVSGEFQAVEEFVDGLSALGAVELARSGPVAMAARPR